MAFDIGAFRVAFPEFASTVDYTSDEIQFWADVAELQVLECIWKRLVTQGRDLYVAHQISLSFQNKKAAANGGVPGTFGGVPNTKTVGSVTVGYDSTVTSEDGAGFWNLTNYGKNFYRLVRIFGAGCIQL